MLQITSISSIVFCFCFI